MSLVHMHKKNVTENENKLRIVSGTHYLNFCLFTFDLNKHQQWPEMATDEEIIFEVWTSDIMLINAYGYCMTCLIFITFNDLLELSCKQR